MSGCFLVLTAFRFSPHALSSRRRRQLIGSFSRWWRRQRQGKRHFEINTCLIVSIRDCPILLAFYNFGKVRYNWIGVWAVKLNTGTFNSPLKRCIVICPSCPQNGKHRNFTLLFCRGWHGLVHISACHTCSTLIFLTRPIKLFICGVVVAVSVVDAKVP